MQGVGDGSHIPEVYSPFVGYVGQELGRFFKGDGEKITAWWFSKNPQLGFLTPAHMVIAGRDERLARFVRSAMMEARPKLS